MSPLSHLLSLLSLCSLSLVLAAPSTGCGGQLPAQPGPGRHHRLEVALTDPGLGEVVR